MELPDRIEDMTPAQREHLDMLVDQVDAENPDPNLYREERLEKDPHLAILPSGRKLSTMGILSFDISGDPLTQPSARIDYQSGAFHELFDRHDIAAFNSALNDIGVYVAAPTLKGDDADGDGITHEGAPV